MERPTPMPLGRRLGDLLVEAGHISEFQLERALGEAKQSNEPLGKILVQRGWVAEEHLGQILSRQAGTGYTRLADRAPAPEALALLSQQFMAAHKVLPLAIEDGVLSVAMVHPNHFETLDEILLLTGLKAKPLVTTSKEFDEAFATITANGRGGIAETLAALREEAREDGTGPLDLQAEDASSEDLPVVRLIGSIMSDAVARNASDIHFEPRERALRVRFRVDGVLEDATEIPRNLVAKTTARLKVMAKLDIAERRRPQDGRARVAVTGKHFDLRINVMPTLWGEKVVVRVLRPAMLLGGLDNLGLSQDVHDEIMDLITAPHGIVLVTGPTGSGKTTTLYSGLYELNSSDRNIQTVEDPIEYPLDGISQTQVHPKAGVTFASTLRSMLRQDPDVLMVGEIRDEETLEAAVFAALTGHLVLSTIHTNDAASTPTRLLEMGLAPYLLTSAVRGVVAQRLVRRLCSYCIEPVPAATLPAPLNAGPVFRASGCERCRRSGYGGRVGIFEVLKLSEPMMELIAQSAPAYRLREQAKAEGRLSMSHDGLRKIRAGVTSPAEVARALGPHWMEAL